MGGTNCKRQLPESRTSWQQMFVGNEYNLVSSRLESSKVRHEPIEQL